MTLYPLLLLLGLFTLVVSAPSSPDPFSHSDLNSWFPPPFSDDFFGGAKFGYVRQHKSEYKSSSLKSAIQLPNSSAPALYTHNGSTASTVAAIGRAVSDGIDVIRLDITCPKIQEDLPLAAAVLHARLRGTVMLCKESPTPKFVQVVAGGPPITKKICFTNVGGSPEGAAYSSKVQVFAADLRLYVFPRMLRFDAAGQANKNVTISVFAHNSGGSGRRRPRWHEAHVEWTSRGDTVTVDDWLFVISVLKSASNH